MLVCKTNLKGKHEKKVQDIFKKYRDQMIGAETSEDHTVVAVLYKKETSRVVCDIRFMSNDLAKKINDEIFEYLHDKDDVEFDEEITEIEELMEGYTDERAKKIKKTDRELVEFEDPEGMMDKYVIKKLKSEMEIWLIKNGELLNGAKLSEVKNVIVFGYTKTKKHLALGFNLEKEVFKNEQDAEDFAEWAAKKVSDASDELFPDINLKENTEFLNKENREERSKAIMEELNKDKKDAEKIKKLVEDELGEVDDELVENMKNMFKNPEVVKALADKLMRGKEVEVTDIKSKALKKLIDAFEKGCNNQKFRDSAIKALAESLDD